MKTILVDAVDAFVIEGEGIFKQMHDLLETYPNRKIILTGANDEQFVKFGLDQMPYEAKPEWRFAGRLLERINEENKKP